MLEVKNICRSFDSFVALDQISLKIEAGEFFTLLGPSGCGKTTLLRMIAGFDQPDSGEILLDGKNILKLAPEKRPIHTIFQNYALFPHMTVEQNIAFPLRMAGCAPQEIKTRVTKALEDVRLPDKGQSYPAQLSGGQKQRVAIARALVNHPRLLLLDEPLSALDAKLREQMQLELINLQKEIGITFVYVTHDQGEALALSHRVAVMNNGAVVQVEEPSRLYGFPNSRFVANFIGQCNLLAGEVLSIQKDRVTVELDGLGQIQTLLPHGVEIQPGQACTLTLRPEKTRISATLTPETDEVHFKGVVHDMLYLGDVTVYKVELENGKVVDTLLANSAPGRARFFEVDDPVEIAWRFDAGHLVLS
ncbi:MAG: ABC transporter ATP-binding protein [Gammaproteobacteria bacterium]|nr:ABC transporter ATP-binding protein [Gammaproteobacteria bacterium]